VNLIRSPLLRSRFSSNDLDSPRHDADPGNVLAKGLSGIRSIVAERICDLLNHKITPVIPSRGSVGASGDLAPLAHMALALIGEGQAE